MTRTQWMTWLGALGSIAALAATQAGCQQTDCGTGTIDQNGSCVPADNTLGSASCGAGTHLGTDGKCDPDFPPTQCDPDTTVPETDPMTGVTTCKGTGGGGCGAPINCGTPVAGKMSICGQLLNVEDNTPIQATGADGSPCDPANPTTDGPCSMGIQAYDAIAFATDPTTATPLPTDEVLINNCGQFRIKNITPNGAQYIGIGLDDNPKAADMHRLTGGALPTASGKALTGFPAYAVKNTIDTQWSTQAGLSGSTFAQRGFYMALFLHGAAPVAGVKITISGGTDPTNDYYFSDTAPASRMTVDPAAAMTGANGAGLMIGHNGNLTTYSGMGGEPTNCKWPSDLGDQITNVAFIQPRVAVQSNAPTMPCP
jgi:hypothetical protein